MSAGLLHLNTGGGTLLRRATGCPVCEVKDAPLVVHESGSPWYSPSTTCTVCGDSWSDGYLGGRPFRRGWRQEAIDEAVADWEAACECPVSRDWSPDGDGYAIPCECAS